MDKWISKLGLGLILIVPSLCTYAVAPGFYIGLQVGAAQNSGKQVTAQKPIPPGGQTTATPTKRQFAARVLLGYKFNPWIAWEGGVTGFSIINYHAVGPTCGRTKVGVASFDTVLKPSLTIGPVDVFAKGGISINYVKNTAALNRDGTCNKSFHEYTFGPVYGIGVSYELSQGWVTDVAWTRVGIGTFVKSFDFYSVGIAYHLVDRYCGQFLCD